MATTTSEILVPTHTTYRGRLIGDLRALWAVTKKEWFYFVRYPTWIINMLLWPIIFPLGYILSANMARAQRAMPLMINIGTGNPPR